MVCGSLEKVFVFGVGVLSLCLASLFGYDSNMCVILCLSTIICLLSLYYMRDLCLRAFVCCA